MTGRDAELFVRDAIEDFLRRRAAGESLEVDAFVGERAGGDAQRAELLRRGLEAALAGSEATLPLPSRPDGTPVGEPGATQPLAAAGGGGRLIDGRYRVERELGEGGFGVVYLVRDELFAGARRALKTLRRELTTDPGIAQRFRNEMVVVKALSHPLVPRFHNDGRTPEGEFYYVMDYVEGRGLDAVLRKEGPLAPDRIVGLMRQLLDVLAYAHGKGVFHRDLKPANILLVKEGTDEEEVRVLDFGIAKILSKSGEFADLESMHTLQGGAIGTPHYMAPEQVTGQGKIDGKTDIYALGVILYQMCSGRVPFTGKTSMEVAAARLTQAPPPLDEDTPAWLRELVMNLLQRQQEKRPSTQELQLGLEQIVKGQGHLHRSLVFIAAGILAVAGGVAWLILDRRPVDEPVVILQPERRVTPTRTASGFPPIQIQSPAEGFRTRAPEIEFVVHAQGHESLQIGETETPVGADGLARTTVSIAPDLPVPVVVRAADGSELARRTVSIDTQPPQLAVELPEGVIESGKEWFTDRLELAFSGTIHDGDHGALPERPVVINSAEPLEFDGKGGFRARLLGLDEGMHTLELTARDLVGHTVSFTRTLHVDRSKPEIQIAEGAATTQLERVLLEGRIEDRSRSEARLWPVGQEGLARGLTLDPLGRFSLELPLELGANAFEIEALDIFGQRTRRTVQIERTAIAVAVETFSPPTGQRFNAGEARVRLSARTNLSVGRLEATRDGQRVEIVLVPRDEGFEAELPLVLGANAFRLVPYDSRDVAGDALEVTYLRELPPTPAGCSLPTDLSLDESGRPTRVIHDASGLELLLVGGGERGGNALAPFYLARTEVTIGDLLRWRRNFYAEVRPAFWDEIAARRELHPAARISFDQARDLGRDLGLRLPSPHEWELAAAGPQNLAFPWGAELEAGALNARDPEDGWPYTAPVGSFPRDQSPFGLLDMAGNVSEWCQSSDGGAELRGGNWSSEPASCRSANPRNPPAGASDTIGLRFALDAPR